MHTFVLQRLSVPHMHTFLCRYDFRVSDKDMEDVQEVFAGDLTLPENFETTAPTLQEREELSKPPSAPVSRPLSHTLLSHFYWGCAYREVIESAGIMELLSWD